ncbi:hypothetical protein LXL04_020756 [Taraxacum kok-saghyz]
MYDYTYKITCEFINESHVITYVGQTATLRRQKTDMRQNGISDLDLFPRDSSNEDTNYCEDVRTVVSPRIKIHNDYDSLRTTEDVAMLNLNRDYEIKDKPGHKCEDQAIRIFHGHFVKPIQIDQSIADQYNQIVYISNWKT